MGAIFSSKGYVATLAAIFILLISGCSKAEPKVVRPPKEAAAVIEPFLAAVKAGDKGRAAAYVAPSATDELDKFFAQHYKLLTKGGKLTPRFVRESGSLRRGSGANRFGDGSEVAVVYAAKTNGTWTTATVRVYQYRDEPFKVEYWRIDNKVPKNPRFEGSDAKALKTAETIENATIIGLGLLGLFGTLLLVWIARRKTHLLAPEQPAETRRSAVTTRDETS